MGTNEMLRLLFQIGLSASLLAGCAGGQTGEITELGACRVAIGEVAIDAASEAGSSAEAQLSALTSELSGTLAWTDAGRAPAAVTVSVALSGQPATLVGGEGCARPFLDAPVQITVRTDDGALDEVLDGVLVLQDAGAAAARARLPLSALRGGLTLEGVDPTRATVLLELNLMAETLSGQLFVRPSDEEDERRLGAL
ncbi:MAG TPA: hypothetical protein DEF51_50605 [Myxococcales bacterium]|nr:hypothetical protein [Myxococcales bacterium]